MSDWYYAENDEQKGPVNEAELKEKFAGAQLAPDTLVWQKGMTQWTPAAEVDAFQFTPPPAPADLPPALPPNEPAAPAAEPAPTPEKPAAEKPAAEEAPQEEEEDFAELGEIIHKPLEIDVEPADFEKNKIYGIMGYIYVLFLVTFLIAPKSPFARYHGSQGATLFFTTTVYWLFIMSLWFVLQNQIPDVIFYVIMFAPPITLAVIGIMNASKGKAVPLPLIGGFTIIN
ncbi:MAG: DUF4339 domain-containing protein [Verrucomicrobiota bacterium]